MSRLHVAWLLLALSASARGRVAAQQSPHGKLPAGLECADCHTPESWKPDLSTVKFDHDKQTRFPLTGQHRSTTCRACHLDLTFAEGSLSRADCATCHADVHRGAYAQRCAECHTTLSFADVQGRQAHARTTFPLTGAHLQLECRACHVDDRLGAFTALDPQCISCHRTAFEQAKPVDHVAGGFPPECMRCHVTLAWSASVTFDHPTVSHGFRLLGAHERTQCLSCHDANLGPLFHPANDQDCVTCHQPDYQRAHPTGSFPATCVDCHNVETWQGSTFDHPTVANGFRLLGAHATLECASCHAADMTPLYHPANDQDCYGCHTPDYQRAHSSGAYPTTCTTCHTMNTWNGATFDHAQFANGFRLRGAHGSLACASCHASDVTPLFHPANDQDCYTCHTSDYQREHANSGFPTTCLSCHTENTWGGATFNHPQFANGFRLQGAHASLACASCHAADGSPLFHPANDQDCYTCHTSDYQSEHTNTGFPTTCLTCHTVYTWGGASFDHAQYANGFRLLGAHTTLVCASCHQPDWSPKFQAANDQDCIACHSNDYQQEHANSGFPTTCLSCHTINSWGGATFDHAQFASGFRLLGAHTSLACASCHAPDMTPLFHPANDQDCIACHQADYDREHPSGQFPTTCLQCHSTATWGGATFVHTSSMTDCASCHHDDFVAAASPVNHIQQGIIESFCNQCHSNGGTPSWNQLTYTHGNCYNEATHRGHQGARCGQCHTSGYQSATCTACHSNRSSCGG